MLFLVIRSEIRGNTFFFFQPKEPIAVKPDITLARRIGHWLPGPDFSRFALRLDASETVADVFQNQNRTSIIFPPPGHLHAFVAQSSTYFSFNLCCIQMVYSLPY